MFCVWRLELYALPLSNMLFSDGLPPMPPGPRMPWSWSSLLISFSCSEVSEMPAAPEMSSYW